MDVLDRFQKIGIIPVVKLENAKDAAPLAKALCEGGLPVAEVTFRTDAAAESICRMKEACPQMLVGAGTVLTTDQVDAAIKAGSEFIVSPGLNPRIVRYCQEKGIPITPGTSSPTDIEQAIELGLRVVKFFPAEASGGIAKIKAMAAPYTSMRFMPTGGINENNLMDYLRFPKVIACGGSWMVKDALINEGKFDEIRRLTREAVDSMLGFELMHVGINTADEKEADAVADGFANMFGFSKKAGGASVFAGSFIEAMKAPYLGQNGHIAIGTNDLARAIYHLELRGFTTDETTAKYDEKGKMVAIYMKEQLGGFAIHLLQK